LYRAPPPLPELSLSEDFVLSTANTVRLELNKVLAIAHDVALGKDFKLFLKVFETGLCLFLTSLDNSLFWLCCCQLGQKVGYKTWLYLASPLSLSLLMANGQCRLLLCCGLSQLLLDGSAS
jgi:hypothetical protein